MKPEMGHPPAHRKERDERGTAQCSVQLFGLVTGPPAPAHRKERDEQGHSCANAGENTGGEGLLRKGIDANSGRNPRKNRGAEHECCGNAPGLVKFTD